MSISDEDFRKLADSFINHCNRIGGDEEMANTILESLRYEHRTIQATFWRVIALVAKGYSEFNSDLRNEAAVDFCKKISEIDGRIPFI